MQDRLHAYVSGCNQTYPPVALQGGDLLRQLRLNSLHYDRWREKGSEREKESPSMMINEEGVVGVRQISKINAR